MSRSAPGKAESRNSGAYQSLAYRLGEVEAAERSQKHRKLHRRSPIERIANSETRRHNVKVKRCGPGHPANRSLVLRAFCRAEQDQH